MKYDFEIDREIVKLLITKGDSVYDADILKYLKKSLRREISPVTYSSHKKVLLDEYIISKTEEGERGRIKYELSKRATQQHRLGILRFNLHKDAMSLDNGQPQEERNLKIFFLILANAIHPVLRQKKRTELLPGFNGREYSSCP